MLLREKTLRRVGQWVSRSSIKGHFWQVLLAACVANSILAVSMNVAAYWLLWPDSMADELATMILLPVLFATIISAPLIYVVYAIITLLRWRNDKIRDVAQQDHLTGLLNRRGFEAQMNAHAGADHFAFLLIDLDHFKKINDLHGHDAGDNALRAVAQVLRSALRERDITGRIGGEEFAVFMPDTTLVQAQAAVQRLRSEMTAWSAPSERFQVTFSGGLVSCAGDPTFSACYRRADRALYRAKHAGRDRVLVFNAQTDAPDKLRA